MNKPVDRSPQLEAASDQVETVSQPIEPIDNPYARQFVDIFSQKFRSSSATVEPRPAATALADQYSGSDVNDYALSTASYAHIAELFADDILRRNISQSLKEVFHETSDTIPVDKRYTLGIMLDILEIRLETKDMLEKNKDISGPFIDHEVLTKLARTTNLEGIVASAAAHSSEFQLLIDRKNSDHSWDQRDEARLHHLAKTIRSVDTVLLELTGYDAFAANALSPVYIWDLESRGRHDAVQLSKDAVTNLGGYQQMAAATDDFLGKLFHEHSISEVTNRQIADGLRFTDGVANLTDRDGDKILTRLLTRLKSLGSLAQKIDHSGSSEIPGDIIGLSLVVDETDDVAPAVNAVLANLDTAGIRFVSAPSRDEQIHIKGSKDFIKSIEDGVDFDDKSWVPEISDRGFEAVKITLMHNFAGIDYPVEIQVTHDISRKNSRHGPASHTLFKLSKLLGLEIPQDELEKISTELSEIKVRKLALAKGNQHLCEASNERVDYFLDNKLPTLATLRQIGQLACQNTPDGV